MLYLDKNEHVLALCVQWVHRAVSGTPETPALRVIRTVGVVHVGCDLLQNLVLSIVQFSVVDRLGNKGHYSVLGVAVIILRRLPLDMGTGYATTVEVHK